MTLSHQRSPRPARTTALGFCLAFAFFAAQAASAAPPTSGDSAGPPVDTATIDAYVNQQMRDQRIPGLALALVQGDRVIYQQGYGSANPQGDQITAQTPFSIGSLTKSFTAIAVMQCVEDGLLELDAPVQRYLPWFQVADREAAAHITLRNLLNHASGLPRDLEIPSADAVDQGQSTLEGRVRALSDVELERPVGAYGYSNAGYQVLALVIEQVTGQTYEAYVRQRIFEPLAMSHSYPALAEAMDHNLATGYHYWFGFPVASGPPPYRSGPGNGGLFSSAEDMGRYLIAQLNQGRYGAAVLASPASVAETHRPAVEREGGHYAMGWGVSASDGLTMLSHSGQTYNYFARMVLVPERGLGVVVLQNSQYTVRVLTDHQSQDAIADGIAGLMLGRQPAERPANTGLALVYGAWLLAIAVQIGGMARSVARLRRWRPGAASKRPGWRLALALNLGWAGITLLAMPLALGNLAETAYQIPDLTYALLASGAVALLWGLARTTWTVAALRRTG